MLLYLPAELLIRIVQHIEHVGDKCQLQRTCRRLNHLLSTHAVCWSRLDLSPYDKTLTNSGLLTFLKNTNIPLFTAQKEIEISPAAAITMLDLSGCWNLSEELIATLSRSLTHLTTLSLNGYRLNVPILQSTHHSHQKGKQHKRTVAIAFEQQRDHVYQVRPSHDLSSMAMDLSKKQTHRLKASLILLTSIVSKLPYLRSLSIQYQDLGGRHHFMEFAHIRHLDISSCIISQPALQTLLRTVGPNLKTLKMLNIDLNNLTWLCVSQFGKQLECLHVSCNEPLLLPSIRHVVGQLPLIQDFRLTRIRTGSVDPVIANLNTATLKRLDLSPKMNIYPRSTSSSGGGAGGGANELSRRTSRVQLSLDPSSTTGMHLSRSTSSSSSGSSSSSSASNTRHNKHPPQSPKLSLSLSNYATTEHDLLFSDVSLNYLRSCKQLVELRLCFPTISASALHDALSHLPQLCIFELRQKQASSKPKTQEQDFLTGLYHCQLRELLLYSVNVTQATIDMLVSTPLARTMKHMTLSECGPVVEKKDNLNSLLTKMQTLEVLCLGQLMQPVSLFDKDVKDDNNIVLYRRRNQQWQTK